jgi:hypothetical protein
VNILDQSRFDQQANKRVEMRTGVRLYQFKPDGEFGDNIVAMSNLKDPLAVSTSVEHFTRFKYRVTAFYPPMPEDCSKAH